ncbi:unnamed protein product, partial [marine sediment metagenome]
CELDQVEGGCDFWAHFEYGLDNRVWTWSCREGDCTEGQQALVANVGAVDKRSSDFAAPYFQKRYYPTLTGSQRAGVILNTFQWLAHTASSQLRNWAGYDLLWVDLKASAAATVWLTVEDTTIGPPVAQVYRVPADKWVTLELDLAEAHKVRGLDLKQIMNLHIFGRADSQATPTTRQSSIRLLATSATRPAITTYMVDNTRLVRKGAAADLPVLRDEQGVTCPTVSFPPDPVVPELDDAYRPDHSRVELELPKRIAHGSLVPVGWVS